MQIDPKHGTGPLSKSEVAPRYSRVNDNEIDDLREFWKQEALRASGGHGSVGKPVGLTGHSVVVPHNFRTAAEPPGAMMARNLGGSLTRMDQQSRAVSGRQDMEALLAMWSGEADVRYAVYHDDVPQDDLRHRRQQKEFIARYRAAVRSERTPVVLQRPAVAAELEAHLARRQCVAFLPVLGWNLSPVETGYFVQPWMEPGEPWPKADGIEMHLVLQLDIATLPVVVRDLLGGRGIFQFFYSPQARALNPSSQSGVLLRRVVPGSEGDLREAPPVVSDEARRMGWKSLRIKGWYAEQDLRWDPELSRVMDDIAERLKIDSDSLTPDAIWENKLLGAPAWSAHEDWPEIDGRPMTLLFQFNAEDDSTGSIFGDDEGMGHIFVDPVNPDRMLFTWG